MASFSSQDKAGVASLLTQAKAATGHGLGP
jgi:hypothetical protein